MRQKRVGLVGAVALLVVALALATASADLAQPSAKAAIKVGDVALLSGPVTSGMSEGPWTTIMSTTIKTPSGKDLMMDVSLECGLHTDTTASSKNGTKDTSSAQAGIKVQILVDGQPAHPGAVTFAARTQTLSAAFQGILNNALSVDPTTGLITIDPALLTPEQVELVLDTMSAHSFNFAVGVGPGVHRVDVQAKIDLGASAQTGSAVAKATIGKGSLTVETVRLVNKGAGIDF